MKRFFGALLGFLSFFFSMGFVSLGFTRVYQDFSRVFVFVCLVWCLDVPCFTHRFSWWKPV